MSQTPRHNENLQPAHAEHALGELPAQPVAAEEARDVAGGLNPQPLPPKWYLPLPYLYTPFVRY